MYEDYSSFDEYSKAQKKSVEALGNAFGEKFLGMDGAEISEYGANVQGLCDEVFDRATSAENPGAALEIKSTDFMELQAAKVLVTLFLQKYTRNSDGDWVTKIINYKPEVAQAISEAQEGVLEPGATSTDGMWFVQMRKVKFRYEVYVIPHTEAQRMNKEDSHMATAHLRAQPSLFRCFFNGRWSKWMDFDNLNGVQERVLGLWLSELPLYAGTKETLI